MDVLMYSTNTEEAELARNTIEQLRYLQEDGQWLRFWLGRVNRWAPAFMTTDITLVTRSNSAAESMNNC
jgi:hypothetical protein